MLIINEAEYIKDYLIWVEFNNNTKGVADFTTIVNKEEFSSLKEQDRFIEYGLDDTIFWRIRNSKNQIIKELDLAPEYILDNLMVK
ncbi:DUF2442 domain-containing protein [Francisella tularensis]|uniref:DUF2442 domain-containing protein n=1 Tax=Francisella tularensis TaxID=263 RepID=UPI0008F55218|nr:DUF2442 domain-containing protein [Francisella tularensis]APA83252.1 hypothetical protein N894_1268 [Francisella tularensis subsp. novicida PA10-7858]